MAVDVLQDVLSTLRFRGNIVGVYTFAAPWGFAIVPNDNDMLFIMVLQGQCILEVDEEGVSPQTLQRGDIVVLPRGSRHTLRDSWDTPVRVLTGPPIPADYDDFSSRQTSFVTGCYEFINSGRNTIFSVLPPLIYLRKDDYQSLQDLDLLMSLFKKQAIEKDACQSVILTRLAEVLFILILRLYASQSLEIQSGWLAALADPPIAAALQEIHADPTAPWTVELLAEKANLSRSAFAERFSRVVGEPPLQYIQRWRMQRAALLLSEGKFPLKMVVGMSGYASEAAFRKAFRRWIGVLPGEYKVAGVGAAG